MYNFNELKEKIKQAEEHLNKELSGIRTGRATISILDNLFVDAYGSKMNLREVANILIEDPRTIRIEPWDLGLLKDIERAINDSQIGVSVASFEKGLRIVFPELTSERREEFVKMARRKLEEAKISLRTTREKTWNDIQDKEKSGIVSEDLKFKLKEEMQKIIDNTNKDFEEITIKKEKEIRQ